MRRVNKLKMFLQIYVSEEKKTRISFQTSNFVSNRVGTLRFYTLVKLFPSFRFNAKSSFFFENEKVKSAS